MKKAGISLILLALFCVGQGFGPRIVKGPTPVFINSGMTPAKIAGLENWWVFTDLITNNQTITDWIDRTAGHHMTNVPTYPKPVTNTQYGMLCQAGSCMEAYTNAGTLMPNSNSALSIVFVPTNNADFCTVAKGKYGSEPSQYVVRRFTGGVWRTGTTAAEATLCADFAANTKVDFLWTSDDAGGIKTYTNGVAAAYTRATAGQFTPSVIGGNSASTVNGLQGYVLEVHYWTNVVFSSANRSNLHYYCTNTYQYAP